MHPAQYYFADLAFSNGQRVENVPLYVPFESGPEAAREVAAQVGAAAANTGVLDLYALAQCGTLPFAPLLFARAEERRQELCAALGVAAADLPHIVSVSECRGSNYPSTTAQVLFAHGEQLAGGVSLSLPPGGDAESLKRWLREAARRRLGETREASHLKVHGKTPRDDDDPITATPRRESLYASPDGRRRVEFFFDDFHGVSLSLRTRDADLAGARAEALWERMRTLLHEQGQFTRRELADYVETLREILPDTAVPPERLRRTQVGAIALRYPDGPGGCKVYLKWGGRQLSAIVSPLHGTSNDRWGQARFTLPADASLGPDQMATLKENLWAFVHDRLEQAFAGGYRFQFVALDSRRRVADGPLPEPFQPQAQGLQRTQDPAQADLELTLTPGRTIGFTPSGWERLTLDVLQGRINTDFVRNALASGYANPFDVSMPEQVVRRLRNGPMPVHGQAEPGVTIQGVQTGGPDTGPEIN